MSLATAVNVSEWIKVRSAVAGKLRAQTSSVKTTEMAESLLLAGWIDVDAVLAGIAPPEPFAGPPVADDGAVTESES